MSLLLILSDSFLVISGYLAMAALITSLSISPLNKCGFKIKIKFRKKIGICSGIIAVFHSLFSIIKIYNLSWVSIRESQQAYTGLIAFMIYVFLLITSITAIQKILKNPSWKNLHRGCLFSSADYSGTQFLQCKLLCQL